LPIVAYVTITIFETTLVANVGNMDAISKERKRQLIIKIGPSLINRDYPLLLIDDGEAKTLVRLTKLQSYALRVLW
jgi:hypothetical protein